MDKAEGRPAPAGESEQSAHEAFRALSVAANEMIIGQQRLMERLPQTLRTLLPQIAREVLKT